jgi:hypothetical protein
MPNEICIPNPEYLIKSIAEQGYTLETSIADLIDNSISAAAKNIEVLIDTLATPFVLFIADDGHGMSEGDLKKNMNFPSSSIEDIRDSQDLGRFGLGMKTASFSQTRRFTVISRKYTQEKYYARTWDVNHLKSTGRWEIIINTEDEINTYLDRYNNLSKGFLNSYKDFTPSTIIIWQSLYKFENHFSLQDKREVLQKELTETTKEYLQLIFHRFMGNSNPIKIRLNNEQLKPFNPFPSGVRNISIQQKLLMGNKLCLEGFVLPNRSLSESKGISMWTLPHKSLMDMEGIYIYRADRIIVFGGWNELIKRSPRLQLARLKIEIGNGIDHLFHLNVAKSSISIPFEERFAFIRYLSILKTEAEKEFFNYETRVSPVSSSIKNIFKKIPTSNGISLEIDTDFPILTSLINTLNEDQIKTLKIILRMLINSINKIRKVYIEENYTELIEKDGLSEKDIYNAIQTLLSSGISKNNILQEILPTIGINIQSLPPKILKLLQ